jgi:hypothetical protein
MLPCIDLHIPDTWLASEAHTPDDARARAWLGPAHARAYAAAGCEQGRSAHTWKDIDIFTLLYNTLARMLTDFVVCMHAAVCACVR